MQRWWGLIAIGTALAIAAFAMESSMARAASTSTNAPAYAGRQSDDTYSYEEIVGKGHRFFGRTTKEMASVVEYAFRREGEPNGYIIGEEGSGAVVGGLRYGEGTLYMKHGVRRKVFWQGPSIGWDFGGNGSRVLVLVYGIDDPSDLYVRFVGVEGTAYIVGGIGVNFQQHGRLKLAPIRTGVGLRLGLNAGYLKYSEEPTWNPF
jgi:hypothetical protein